ncbi:spore germination protein GerPB [Halobacillus shinanisalinarum]|uniref:Spore germination protein GerPB n=1 Tax=Halobacillus shinanisalinarum TaxID=2932258 RepID=A0ABY4GXI5_9BACI|nr:spore germination protein GerPB [Halobacillus shinanisalinarum]UOQ92798.1 spore germination protein GerPB [Halobacillus shinanisalinarum]
MNLTIHQTISIRVLRIGTVANSSIVQIGSSGVIQAKADLYNTGGFTEAAEVPEPAGGQVTVPELGSAPLVPLSVT